MKYVITIAVFFYLNTNGFCQSKKIPVSLIYEQQVVGLLIKEDSLVKKYDAPLLEVFRFYVRVDKAFFDPVSKEIRIAGQVCHYVKEKNCAGLQGVTIFKGRKNEENLLKNVVELGASSFVQDSLDKNGFFDFKFKIGKEESLFFFTPHYYLDEFKLGGLINKMETTKKRKTVHHH